LAAALFCLLFFFFGKRGAEGLETQENEFPKEDFHVMMIFEGTQQWIQKYSGKKKETWRHSRTSFLQGRWSLSYKKKKNK
jgi:hypothetical protein